MKKNLKGEAFLSPICNLLEFLTEPTQRSLSRFMESEKKENFKEEKGEHTVPDYIISKSFF